MSREFLNFRMEELPQNFVQLAGSIVRSDPSQLGAQLLARMNEESRRQLDPRLQAAAESAVLRLMHPTVAQSGGLLLGSFQTTKYIGAYTMAEDDTLYMVLSGGMIAAWNMNQLGEPHLLSVPSIRGVGALAQNPHDASLALGYSDGQILLGKQSYPVHENCVAAIAFFRSSPSAASIDSEGKARIWDVRTGQILMELEDTNPVHWDWLEGSGFDSIHITSSRIVAYTGSHVSSWCLNSGRIVWKQELDSFNEGAFAISADGQKALINEDFIDPESGQRIGGLQGWIAGKYAHWSRPGSTKRAAFSRDGLRLYTLERKEYRVCERDAGTGEPIHTFHVGDCAGLVTDSKNRLVSLPGSEYGDQTIRCGNPTMPAPIAVSQPGIDYVRVDQKGARALTKGDYSVKLWDLDRGETEEAPRRSRFVLEDGGLLSDFGTEVEMSLNDPEAEKNAFRVGDVFSSAAFEELFPELAKPAWLAEPAETEVAGKADSASDLEAGTWDWSTLWAAEDDDGSSLSLGPEYKERSPSEFLAFGTSAGGEFVLFVNDNGDAELWDSTTKQRTKLDRLGADFFQARNASFYPRGECLSRDGRYWAENTADQGLLIWDLFEGTKIASEATTEYRLSKVQIASGGRHGIFSFDGPYGCTGFQVQNGAIVWRHEDRVLTGNYLVGLSLTTDGRLAVLTFENTVSLWDFGDEGDFALRQLATFSGDFRMRCAAISGDGSCIAVGDETGRLHVFEVQI